MELVGRDPERVAEPMLDVGEEDRATAGEPARHRGLRELVDPADALEPDALDEAQPEHRAIGGLERRERRRERCLDWRAIGRGEQRMICRVGERRELERRVADRTVALAQQIDREATRDHAQPRAERAAHVPLDRGVVADEQLDPQLLEDLVDERGLARDPRQHLRELAEVRRLERGEGARIAVHASTAEIDRREVEVSVELVARATLEVGEEHGVGDLEVGPRVAGGRERDRGELRRDHVPASYHPAAMPCLDERTALAILDGTLARDELSAMSAHLDDCAYCRALVAAIGRADGSDSTPPALTALEPGTRIGKFVVERELGAGANGAVYAVRDPELDREVALKLLHYRGHASADDEEVLLREARAMAKLSHPNLVPIYEAGRWEDSVYVAMELIAGGTLRDWLAAPHGDPLALLLGAGRGLAAAHDAGVIHRDFKPENILVGPDGRARVGDFAIALHANDIVGTPAYMAPEQLRGEPADARSDQFGYCVVVYEAIAGERPATPLAPLRSAAWPVLARGLSAAPAERYPDMHALLAALEPRRTRRLAIAGALAATAIAATAAPLVLRPAAAPCAPVALAAWNPIASETARTAFLKTGSPIAAATFERTAAALDRYATAWTAQHTEACTATRVRHEASDALLDRRTQCLAERRAEVAAIAGELARATRATVEQAPAAIAALPSPAACATPDSDADPVTDPDAAALRERLQRATALAGFDVSARTVPELAAIIQRAGELHMPKLRAEALTTRGFVKMTARDDAGAMVDLEEAAYAAEATKLDHLAARASTALISAATDAGDLARARTAVRPGDAAVTRLGAGGDERSELLARIAWLELHEGNLAGAETDARAAIADGCRGEVATLATCAHYDVLATVLFSAGKLSEALDLYRKNLALIEQQFGPSHPKTARAVERVANTLDKLGRHADALAMYDRSLAITGDVASGVVATLYDNSGSALMMLGKLPEAEARIRRALALHEQLQGPDHPEVATTLVNLANVLDREGKDSLELRQRALRIFEAKLPPDHPLTAVTLSTIGYHFVVAKQPAVALTYLQRAAAIQAKKLGTQHPDYAYTLALIGSAQLDAHHPAEAVVTLEQALASPGTDASAKPDLEFNLADALWQSGGDHKKARTLVEAAFAANPDPEFKRWLAKH